MSTPDPSGDGEKKVTQSRLETRILEGALIVCGAGLLFVGGFALADSSGLGVSNGATTTVVGPVTFVHQTTLSSTGPLLEYTNSKIVTTRTENSSSAVSDTALGVILGLGAALVLAGAFYRRDPTIDAGPVKFQVGTVVADPERIAAAVQTQAARDGKQLTAAEASAVAAAAAQRLAAQVVVPVAPPSKPSLWSRLRASQPFGYTTEASIPVDPTAIPDAATASDPVIADAVDAAFKDLNL